MKTLKRALMLLAGLAAGLVAAFVVTMVLSFAGTRPLVDGDEPAPGVRAVKEKFVATYVLDAGPGRVVLVDAGMDRKAGPILKELSRRGLGPEAVTAILLTHGHSDHIGGAACFPRATVCALAADAALAEGRAGSPSPLGRFVMPKPTGVKVGRTLRDGETVRFGSLSVRVFAVPGHTAGSAAYLARGVLFLGDSADSLAKGGISGAKLVFSEDRRANRESLKSLASRLKSSGVAALAFSHSAAILSIKPLLDFAEKN